MAELNLLPAPLNISCVAGDDVVIVVTIQSGTACDSRVANIQDMSFESSYIAGDTVYNAAIAADPVSSKVTVSWSDSQTAQAGPGVYPWSFKVTESGITRTRLKGLYKVT